MHVFLNFTALHIKNVYKDLYVLKNIVSLTCKVAVHKGILPRSEGRPYLGGVPRAVVSQKYLTRHSPKGVTPGYQGNECANAPHQLNVQNKKVSVRGAVVRKWAWWKASESHR